MFIHRRTYPPFFASRLARFGVPMVFDLDDPLYLPPPSAPQEETNRARHRRNFAATVDAADLVLCGNLELASHVPHGRTALVPTALDCRRFRPGAAIPGTGPVVGWVGHSDNLSYLEALSDPLRSLARHHPGLRLVVVADQAPRIEGVDVEFREWNLEREISCFDGIAVGLMPLEDNPWTRAKCAFKLLQYMALGIPSVASPVGMNRDVVDSGRNSFLASTHGEWFECIHRLLDDAVLRRRLAEEGRCTVVDRYSLDVISPQLIELLRGVFELNEGNGRCRPPAPE